MKPIETRYKGYRFRSRLEARWAVFFDTLGIAWEYEKEGYGLPSGPYLPDFWLPKEKFWIEIKPEYPTSHEITLVSELRLASGKDCFIAIGTPNPETPNDHIGWEVDGYENRIVDPGYRDDFKWAICRRCDNPFPWLAPEGYGNFPCSCKPASDPEDDVLIAAYAAARSARFEHGETP